MCLLKDFWYQELINQMQPYYVTRPKDATLLYDLTIYGSGQGIHMGGLLLCWPLSLF